SWRDHALGNPCRGVERNREDGKERFLSTTELAAVTDALAAYGTTPTADCIRLILLTGCRPDEAKQAIWAQFDLPGFWIKPSSHTKQRKVHRAPLNPAAQELVERLRPADYKPTDFVFPGEPGKPLQKLQGCWDVIRRAATVALWEQSG